MKDLLRIGVSPQLAAIHSYLAKCWNSCLGVLLFNPPSSAQRQTVATFMDHFRFRRRSAATSTQP